MTNSYPTIDSDRDHLILDQPRVRKWCFGHPRLALILACLALIVLGHGLAVYFIYFRCSNYNCVGLKVVALNTWGMPTLLGSEYKTERMKGIGDQVAKGDYDVMLLEELWMEGDHWSIAERLPAEAVMTGFRQLALSTCDGRVAPWGCSGLAVISKYNFTEVEFNSYTYHGDGKKAFIDGEVLAKKGVGRVRIEPSTNLTIDIFVTHTAADPDPSHGYNNSYYRVRQVRELMNSYVTKSDADIVILGGDFNAEPVHEEGSPYQMVKEHMTNCIQEIFYKLDEWLNAKFATYGNDKNTFTGGKYKPVTYDYIFHKTNNLNRTLAWTNWFDLPFFRTIIDTVNNETDVAEAKEISLSDHEGIESTIYFWK